jgi:hypothetical protein
MRTLLNIVKQHDDLSAALKEVAELLLVMIGTILIAPSIIWLASTNL